MAISILDQALLKIFLLTELPQKHNGPWQAKGREQFLEQATAR